MISVYRSNETLGEKPLSFCLWGVLPSAKRTEGRAARGRPKNVWQLSFELVLERYTNIIRQVLLLHVRAYRVRIDRFDRARGTRARYNET